MNFGAFMGQERAGHKVQAGMDWAAWRADARRAVLWLPVAMGAGIWLYFALDREPPVWWSAWVLVPLVLIVSGWARRAGLPVLILAGALATAGVGFALAQFATYRAGAPALSGPVEETVDGRVRALSRAASGAPRVLLDQVTVYGLDPRETPARVRVTLLAADRETAPRPGERVRVFARLLPPGEPVEPGAFDFGMRAFFDGLGAVGYARGATIALGRAPPGHFGDRAAIWLAERRLRISDAIQAALLGRRGAFAAAIVTGDRSGIEEADAEALRVSNLAHLLAISGLHMGLLTGLVFAALRLLIVVVGPSVSGARAKKLAAVGALAAGLAYLLLSGATVATQRAFVMMAVAFVAVLLDRPVITLRGLALAAIIVLAIRPVSLMDVGFQMSFAATAALVAGWEEVRRRRRAAYEAEAGAIGQRRGWARVGRVLALYLAGLVFTSVIAGAATAPYAAYHFNRVAPYGLPANLAAVPVMGLVIAPAAIAAGVLAPFGQSGVALQVMGAGIDWVLEAAHWIAAQPGATRAVPVAPASVLALITLGGLWLFLWRGRWRFLGIAGVLLALVLWSGAERRPEVLIAPGARLIGVMGPEGRVLDHPRAQSFAAKTWLRRDGDAADQKAAAARPGLTRGRGWSSALLSNGWRLEVVHSRRVDMRRLRELCQPRTLLVVRNGPEVEGPCRYLGATDLARFGAVAVRVSGEVLELIPANDPSRRRTWSRAVEQSGAMQKRQ